MNTDKIAVSPNTGNTDMRKDVRKYTEIRKLQRSLQIWRNSFLSSCTVLWQVSWHHFGIHPEPFSWYSGADLQREGIFLSVLVSEANSQGMLECFDRISVLQES